MGLQQDHKLDALFTGTADIHFARGAANLDDTKVIPWDTLGNLPKVTVNVSAEFKEHMGSYRGRKKLDRTTATEMKIEYQATADEFDWRNLGFLFFGDPDYDWGAQASDNSQTGLSAAAGAPFDFDAGDDGVANRINGYYDLYDTNGKRVTDITAVTLAGTNLNYGSGGDQAALVEGIDFVVDKKLGGVRFLVSINDDVITPTITSKTITSSSDEYMQYMKVLEKAFAEGMCRVFIWDDDDKSNLVWSHEDFKARISVEGGPEVNGDDWSEMNLVIKVTVPEGFIKVGRGLILS